MDSNEEILQKHVVINGPGQRSEVLTRRIDPGPLESGLSPITIAIFAILAMTTVAVVLYIISNRNANLEVASQTSSHDAPATTIVQQPAQQAPVIIQQPASGQQGPVIIQQPNQRDSASDDANMQEIATKRLGEQTDMNAVSITITDASAVLTGTVNSAATKAKAEQIVKAVRGVKSVDNRIVVTG